MENKKIKGDAPLIEPLLVIAFIGMVIIAIVIGYKAYNKNSKQEGIIELLSVIDNKNYSYSEKVTNNKNESLDFIRNELNLKDFNSLPENMNMSLKINSKNSKLESFYLVYTPIEVPFYTSNPKEDLYSYIQTKRKDKKENHKYYLANSSDIAKELTIDQCEKSKECVLVIASIKT